MTQFNISIVSDTVCPWCYLGHKRLQKAITTHKAQHPEDNFTTTWRPYQLNPNASTQSVDKRAFYEERFGEERLGPMFERMSQLGDEWGIKFSFGGRTGNTRTSHRLIEHARAKEAEAKDESVKGLQTRLVEALFSAYFENEQDITSHAVLKQAGIKAGLDESEIDRVLNSDEGGAVVDKEASEARHGGVNGVPFFQINDSFAVEGAQEPQAFQTLFERIKKSKM